VTHTAKGMCPIPIRSRSRNWDRRTSARCSQHAWSTASSSAHVISGNGSTPLHFLTRMTDTTSIGFRKPPVKRVGLSTLTRSLAIAIATAVMFAGLVAGAIIQRATATPTDLAARTETWLEQTLRVELTDRPFTLMADSTCGGVATDMLGCEAVAFGNRIEVTPFVWWTLDNAERTRLDPYRRGALVLHELLHDNHAPTTPRHLEEGIVEAVALDLYPAWAKWVGLRPGPRDIVSTSYPKELDAVRKASALATGKPWKSRAARLWRRDLWRADAATRVAVYEAAWR
jgi:hypothetical protein